MDTVAKLREACDLLTGAAAWLETSNQNPVADGLRKWIAEHGQPAIDATTPKQPEPDRLTTAIVAALRDLANVQRQNNWGALSVVVVEDRGKRTLLHGQPAVIAGSKRALRPGIGPDEIAELARTLQDERAICH